MKHIVRRKGCAAPQSAQETELVLRWLSLVRRARFRTNERPGRLNRDPSGSKTATRVLGLIVRLVNPKVTTVQHEPVHLLDGGAQLSGIRQGDEAETA
jgi:hypothetical protein